MDVSSVRPTQQTPQAPLVRPVDVLLRLGLARDQILEGRVVDTQGRRATIDFGGREITAETQAALAPGDEVVLRVRDASGDVVRMQVLERLSPGALHSLSGPELQAALRSLGLEPTLTMEALAREFIALGLPLDPKTLGELAARLAQLGQTSPENLRAAALLQQLGLPVTAASLELARAYLQGDGPLGRALRGVGVRAERLAALLQRAGTQNAGLQGALEQFDGLLAALRLFETEGQLPGRLAQLSADVATPLEAKLAQLADDETPSFGRDLRMALEQLAQELDALLAERPGGQIEREAAALRAALRRMGDELAFQQLTNAGQPPSETEAGRYYVWQLPWSSEPGWESVRVKVQRDPDGRHLDPAAHAVHMRFEFDLEGLGSLTSDILVHRERVACHFTSVEAETARLLAAHREELVAALADLGYRAPDIRAMQATAPPPRSARPPAPQRRIDTVV